jgi:hypothetical protein
MVLMDRGVTRWMLVEVKTDMVDVDGVDRVSWLSKAGRCTELDVMLCCDVLMLSMDLMF